eukprot:1152788-Pelagomonas_calceolata.AAC.1
MLDEDVSPAADQPDFRAVGQPLVTLMNRLAVSRVDWSYRGASLKGHSQYNQWNIIAGIQQFHQPSHSGTTFNSNRPRSCVLVCIRDVSVRVPSTKGAYELISYQLTN